MEFWGGQDRCVLCDGSLRCIEAVLYDITANKLTQHLATPASVVWDMLTALKAYKAGLALLCYNVLGVV